MSILFDGGDAFSTYVDSSTDTGYAPRSRSAGQVMSQIKRKFGDESGVQLEDADIIAWINDAQMDICQREKLLKAKATAQSIPGTSQYRFPVSSILEIDSIHYKGRKIDNVSFAQAEQDYINDEDVTDSATEPIIWYEWAGAFTFYPTPNTSELIEIYFSRVPDTISLANDTLGVPDKYFNSIVHYVLQQAYEMDEDWAASQAKSQQYTESLTAVSDEERTSQNMTYQTITEIIPY